MTSRHDRVVVLVKALPDSSQKYGEVVCCAGVTAEGEWRRLFPIRFRHLRDSRFERWQWVDYDWRKPTTDQRPESRTVLEETIKPSSYLKKSERAPFLAPLVLPSTLEAEKRGQTLTLIRPLNPQFRRELKSQSEIESEKLAYEQAARQQSFFDEDLKALDPCPYRFSYRYETADGQLHNHQCLDWEIAATYFRFSRYYGEKVALEKIQQTFGERYPRDGMVLALGTHSRRPKQWLLVGIIRLDEVAQQSLDL